jgi:hypothetical protein
MFVSAFLKIERAKHHVRDLSATLRKSAQSVVINFEPNGGATVKVKDQELLVQTCALIIGDAVHNLRAALEHAFWELMGHDSGTQDRYTSFPTGNNRINYEASCNGIKTPRQDTKDFLISLQAYEGGVRQSVHRLHHLDVADKHHLLTPVLGFTALREIIIVRDDGTRERFNHIGTALNQDGTVTEVPVFGPGKFEQTQDTDATVDVFFADIESFKFSPVVPVLDEFVFVVREAVSRMRDFVETRS